MKKLEFGYECKDIVTGFSGILKTRAVFMTGCDRVELVKDSEEKWSDVPVTVIVGDGVFQQLQETGLCNMYDDIDESLYDFGILVKDIVTGYEGKIVAKTIGISGDISYGLSPKFEKDSKSNDAVWFDESRIDVISIKKDEITVNPKRVGGAVPNLKCR